MKEKPLNPASAETVSFVSGPYRISALLYRPAAAGPVPAIVMGLGTANLKEWFGDFAHAFAAAGFAVLVIDYPHWGESSGEPRQHIDPWAQVESCRNGVSYLATRPFIDPSRIGIWGSSGGGGNVLVAGALDRRIKAIVAQIPLVYNFETSRLTMSVDQLDWIASADEAERCRLVRGEPHASIALVDPDPAVASFMTDPKSLAWLMDMARATPDWRNELTLASLDKVISFAPEAYAERISAPTLLIVAKEDDLTPASLARAFADRIGGACEIVWIEGTHLAPFLAEKAKAVRAAASWFSTHL